MKIYVAVLTMVLGAAGVSARAAPPPSDAGIDLPLEGAATNANWRSVPSSDEFWREYPPLAAMMNMAGSATVSCNARTDGRLDDCSIVSEEPVGLGFGAAAMRLTAYFNMNPATRDGHAVDSRVQVPVHFELDGAAPPPADPVEPPVDPAALALAREVVAREEVEAGLKTTAALGLQKMSARSVVDGDVQKSQIWIDALRLGLDDAAAAEADRQAHQMAAHMSLAELKATAAFLATPAGKAWTAAQAWNIGHPPAQDFFARGAQAAKARYCSTNVCNAISPTRASATTR